MGGSRANRTAQHINGIESLWSYATRRLAKFDGVPRHLFNLHLNETKSRFDYQHQALSRMLLRKLRADRL